MKSFKILIFKGLEEKKDFYGRGVGQQYYR